jgi:putative FmdB family regulatory protein
MPLYEYECESCGTIFEARQKFSDAPLSSCRDCGGPVTKLISRTEFALKGGGWYDHGYSKAGAAAPSCAGSDGGGCSSCPNAVNS